MGEVFLHVLYFVIKKEFSLEWKYYLSSITLVKYNDGIIMIIGLKLTTYTFI